MKAFYTKILVLLLVVSWIGVLALTPTPTCSAGCSPGNGLVFFQPGNINQTIPRADFHNEQDRTDSTQLTPSSTVAGGILTGTVTNCSNGNPIVGAKICFGTNCCYSVAGGSFTLEVFPASTASLTALKCGFDNYSSPPLTLISGVVTVYNICMNESPIPPGQPFTASLDATGTFVNLSWSVPSGPYEIIYDDGIPENFTVWSTAGNMNAVKFTPIAYPIEIIAGKVNVGQSSNYPSSTTLPLTAFQMTIYDASGPNGMPGQQIANPIDVTANAFGWIEFNFPSPTTITGGAFYLVMIQGGIPPQAAGMAIDESIPQLRSYTRFASGSGPWLPANGNFMMRAVCIGQGGPLMLDAPDNIFTYQVWRLEQCEELTPGVWTGVVGPITYTTAMDFAWPTLYDGAYRWAVKALYPGNRWSEPVFSNVLGKNWSADVTISVTLSCEAQSPEGTMARLISLNCADSTYTGYCNANGTVNFSNVIKGSYKLEVTRFGYSTYTMNSITIMGPMTYQVTLLEEKAKPRYLFVNDRTLLANWNKPRFEKEIWKETFVSGNLSTNQWIASDAHWIIATGTGNPAPSVMWNYSPQATGYNSYLTSKNLPTENAGTLLVQYDIFLDNFGNSTLEQMALEVWNGTSWIAKRTWDNSSGANIPWTTDVVDITTEAGTQPNAKIRFHAFGEDSYNIDAWYMDNITLLGASANAEECVLGYNFYLNNTLMAYTPDTTYQIPPSQVHYGWLYEATVKAIYGSGYSDTARYTFSAHFLYPPTNLQAIGIEDVAYLTWGKPIAYDGPALDQTRPAATGTGPASETGVGNSQGLDMTYITSNATDALFDNGPFVNSPGTGAGGADESVLQTGLTLFGSNMNQALGYSIADDFFVPPGNGWDPVKFTFFGYQTDAPNTGTFTGVYFRIYDGPPNAGGTVIWGDLTTNRMISQMFVSCYRVQTIAGGTSRAIIKLECIVTGLHLSPGTYWIEVQTTGNPSYSGPWANPVTINGTLATGNGLQWTGSAWNQWLDGSYQQGLPFIIQSTECGGTPPGLWGYRIYRGSTMIHEISNPDSLEYYDVGLELGTYIYNVSAMYDLTPYGFPGLFDESSKEGPDTVILAGCCLLPFHEPWDQGQFAFNEWRFKPNQSNWTMNTSYGNPAPTADFTWQPLITSYESRMESRQLCPGKYQCGNVWLNFDWKLVNMNATGTEKMVVEIYYDSAWHMVKEITNDNSYDWTSEHLDISGVIPGYFRIAFRVLGENSSNIQHWYVDNIYIYGECLPAVNLTADVNDANVTLSWSPPQCQPVVSPASSCTYPYTSSKTTEGLTVSYYIWRRSNSDTTWTRITPGLVADTTYVDANLPSDIYRYYVESVFSNGCAGNPSNETEAGIIVGTGPTKTGSVSVFPNPASDHIRIQSSTPVESCDLFNFMGHRVFPVPIGNLTEFTIPVSTLPQGIYLVKLKNSSGTTVTRVSVVHQ